MSVETAVLFRGLRYAHINSAVLLDGALEEGVRHVEDGAGAVSRVDLAAACAAVLHAAKHGEGILKRDHEAPATPG